MLVSSERSRSGLAWARCSCRKSVASILGCAAIAGLLDLERELSSKDHAVAALHVDATPIRGRTYITLLDTTWKCLGTESPTG